MLLDTNKKLDFLQKDFLPMAQKIDPSQKGLWGKMSAAQMLEHVAKFFQVSTNKRFFPLLTLPDHLSKYREFLWSDKAFRENTKAAMLPDEPEALIFEKFSGSLSFLEAEVNAFFLFFANSSAFTTQHPVFGDLNFDDWVQLHHKHVTHHLRQFGVVI
ncbi:MAG: DUF1569 domain-containing protein [Chitinophagaceae bacterium]